MMILKFNSITAALLLSLSSSQGVHQSSSSLRGTEETTKEQNSNHRHLFAFDNPSCGDAEYATQPYYVSPSGNNWSMENGWGLSVDKPFKTIQHAVDNRDNCQTIYVMEGVYQNNYYGQSFNHNNKVVNLNGGSSRCHIEAHP